MLELFKEIIGYSATVIGTSLMLPQLYKSFTTKSLKDLSWGRLILYFLNCLLWLIYGFLISSAPLMIANGIGFLISILQIVLKVKY